MEGELFHIYLTGDARPFEFCANTLGSIPYTSMRRSCYDCSGESRIFKRSILVLQKFQLRIAKKGHRQHLEHGTTFIKILTSMHPSLNFRRFSEIPEGFWNSKRGCRQNPSRHAKNIVCVMEAHVKYKFT